VKVDPKILVIADQRAPYQTIKSVLASAAVHGYTDFKLAVVKGE
jgi:biopolymer transport protein ExbD